MMTIGDSLKKIRIEHGLTQKEMAIKLNVSYQTISKWELNKSLPSLEMIVSISLIFEISIDSIVFGQKKLGKENRVLSFLQNLKNENPFKDRKIEMNFVRKKINFGVSKADLFLKQGVFIDFYNQKHVISHDLFVHWILSLNDDNFIELVSKDDNFIYKIVINDLASVSFKLAKTFLGTAPGIFFSTKVILEIELIFKEKNKNIILLSDSISIFPEFFKYFNRTDVTIMDSFNLEKELKNVSKEDTSEFIYGHFDKIVEKYNIKEVEFFSN